MHFIFLFFLFISNSYAVTLTSGQTDYTTPSDITTSGIGISSSLSGTSSSPNKIKNIFTITTGNSGATSGAYGIRSSGTYNQITNSVGANIITTGSSGRGISITNNSIAINQGSISTQGTTAYGIYTGGNSNSVQNSGTITTNNTTAYGIYLNGDNNSASNSGTLSTKVYGIYSDGNVNQINNSGTITTTTGSSAHGIFMSAGSGSTVSSGSHGTISNTGIINSSGNGIYAKDNYTAISNSGTIATALTTSIYGIRSEGDNSTITNLGTITSQNYAIYNSGINSVINNYGALNGGVFIGNGSLNLLGGSISGVVEGNASGNINIGTNFAQTAAFNNLDNLTISAGNALNSYAAISANKISLGDSAVLNLNSGSSISGAIEGTSASTGIANIYGSINANGTIGILGKSLANLNIASSGALTALSDIYADNISVGGNLNFLAADNMTIHGNLAGSGSGVVNFGSKNQIIAGNFTLNSGDSLALTLKNGGVGNVTVSGISSIDSNSKLAITTSADQGYIANNTRYTIIDGASGSVVNTIPNSNILVNGISSNNYGLLRFSTSAVSNDLVLHIDRINASEVTTNKNIQNIYQSLNDIGSSSRGKLLQFQNYLDNSTSDLREISKSINQLAPQSSKATLAATYNITNNLISVVENRLEKTRFSEEKFKNGIWGEALGGALSQSEVKDDDGYKINSLGVVFGADHEFFDNGRIGVSLGLSKSNIKNSDKNKDNAINSFHTNIYAAQNFGKYFTNFIGGISLNEFSSNRAITAIKTNANAKYFGETYALKLKGGIVNNLDYGLSLTPEIALNFLRNNIGGYSEKGADELNLNIKNVSANFLETRIGLNLTYMSPIYPEITDFQKFATTFKISYGHAFINDAPTTKATFASNGTEFNSQISHLDNDSIKCGAEFFAYHNDIASISADYNFEHKATSNSHLILLKIREEF